MRTIPAFINRHSQKVPPGEIKFFDLLKNSKDDDGLIALHSLELPVHIKKRNGEMDFVILFPPLGIIGVEVKSHKNIYVQNGKWYFNDTPKDESPFTQIKDNVISLRKRIEARYPALKWLMYQRLVVFTHTNLIDKPSAEFDRWEILQQEDFNKKDFNIVESLRRVLIKCSDNLKETKVGKNVGIKELDKSSMNLIADFLRPDYEHYVSPRDRVNNIEKEIKNYTTEQFKTLDTISEIPHVYVHGSAGTGKTFIAIEAARRKYNSGKKVLLIIYNSEIKEFLKKELYFAKNIGIFSMHEIYKNILGTLEYERMLANNTSQDDFAKAALEVNKILPEEEKFDCLIIDECQDIASFDNLLILQQFINEDLQKTEILFFGDHKYQQVQNKKSLNYENIKKEFLQDLQSIPLYTNCRNTADIIKDIQRKVENDIVSSYKHFLRGNSDEPKLIKTYTYDDHQNLIEKLISTIKDLKKEGFKSDDITILTRNSQSVKNIFENKKLESFGLTQDPTLRENLVYISTYRKFKGLENHIILIIGIEDFGSDFDEFIYIASSRSKDRLISFYQSEFYEKIKLRIKDNLISKNYDL